VPGSSSGDLRFAASSDFVIHPGIEYEIAEIRTFIPDHEPSHPDLVFEFELAAENFRLKTGKIRVAAAHLLRTIGRKLPR
jgi:hypothetical protein